GDRVAAVQRLPGLDPGQQLQPGRVPVPRFAGIVVDRIEVGTWHRPGRRTVPRTARGATAGDDGVARRLNARWWPLLAVLAASGCIAGPTRRALVVSSLQPVASAARRCVRH